MSASTAGDARRGGTGDGAVAALGGALQDGVRDQPGKAMFGIVQGGDVAALRARSAEALKALDLKGYSIGGLAVRRTAGRDAGHAGRRLPDPARGEAPISHGVGTPDDILKSVARGVDMFDCVCRARAGRHGLAYTRRGQDQSQECAATPRIRARSDEESDCPAARDYSRAYLHHLVKSRESLGGMLLTWNNIAYYQSLMATSARPSKQVASSNAPAKSPKLGTGRSAVSLGPYRKRQGNWPRRKRAHRMKYVQAYGIALA